jgi:hypothetical protein
MFFSDMKLATSAGKSEFLTDDAFIYLLCVTGVLAIADELNSYFMYSICLLR